MILFSETIWKENTNIPAGNTAESGAAAAAETGNERTAGEWSCTFSQLT